MPPSLLITVGNNQSEAIKNRKILHSFYYQWHNSCVQKLNKNPSVVSLELISSILRCISLDMETNSFTRLNFIHMIHHIESKIKINGLLSDPLTIMRVRQVCLLSMLLYITVIVVLANFITTDKMIKEIQIEDHEIKIVFFLTIPASSYDITCINI